MFHHRLLQLNREGGSCLDNYCVLHLSVLECLSEMYGNFVKFFLSFFLTDKRTMMDRMNGKSHTHTLTDTDSNSLSHLLTFTFTFAVNKPEWRISCLWSCLLYHIQMYFSFRWCIVWRCCCFCYLTQTQTQCVNPQAKTKKEHERQASKQQHWWLQNVDNSGKAKLNNTQTHT